MNAQNSKDFFLNKFDFRTILKILENIMEFFDGKIVSIYLLENGFG